MQLFKVNEDQIPRDELAWWSFILKHILDSLFEVPADCYVLLLEHVHLLFDSESLEFLVLSFELEAGRE